MDLIFLSQADSVTLKLELAKKAVESAKFELDSAKAAYEELFAQADTHGFPKAKLKKLTEERVQSLIECGIIAAAPSPETKRERPAKKNKTSTPKIEDEDLNSTGIEAHEFADSTADATVGNA